MPVGAVMLYTNKLVTGEPVSGEYELTFVKLTRGISSPLGLTAPLSDISNNADELALAPVVLIAMPWEKELKVHIDKLSMRKSEKRCIEFAEM